MMKKTPMPSDDKNNLSQGLSSKSSASCDSGSDMWRDSVLLYGIDEAVVICRKHLDVSLKRELSEDEGQFNRDLFSAMYADTASRVDASKLIYPYSHKVSYDKLESTYYHTSRKLNNECAKSIDVLINESCYKPNHHNLEVAAMRAIQDYGFQRVCLVLAFNCQRGSWDGRFSEKNKNWARDFIVPIEAFSDVWLRSHPALVDGFCENVRNLYRDLGAENFALPGKKENGVFVGAIKGTDNRDSGHEIIQSITTSDDGNGFSSGYAIGHNPKAVSPWVCWQFAVHDGQRHFNWGVYSDNKQDVIDAYNANPESNPSHIKTNGEICDKLEVWTNTPN